MTPPVPLLSIGLPVFNGERFLTGAIESILQQTFGDFTLVISDSASTDGTEEIGREFACRDPRITFVRRSHNRGAAWTFNTLPTRWQGRSSSGQP